MEVQGFKEQFDAVDTEFSGTINHYQLKQVLGILGQTVADAQVAEYINEFDANRDGKISFPEFLSCMWRLQSGPSEKEIVSEMFQTFDDNFMGFIGVDELRNLFRKANAESGGRIEIPDEYTLAAMIREADLDQDGRLNPEEFAHVVEQCNF